MKSYWFVAFKVEFNDKQGIYHLLSGNAVFMFETRSFLPRNAMIILIKFCVPAEDISGNTMVQIGFFTEIDEVGAMDFSPKLSTEGYSILGYETAISPGSTVRVR